MNMRILLIEDEVQAAWNLQQTILKLEKDAVLVGLLDSLSDIQKWFNKNDLPDLIFSDIQLGDGNIFDSFIATSIPCPIIFCTAYDEFLLQAFKVNGIDYLLKPIDDKEVKRSLDKFHTLKKTFSTNQHNLSLHKAIHQILDEKLGYKTNFLLPHRDKLIPVESNQIAFFKVNDTCSDLCLKNGKTYHHSFTLEYLSSVLNPRLFFRVNRQFLLAFDSIREIEHAEDRKLLIYLNDPCNDKILVSKAKAPEFLHWMQDR